MPRVRVLIADDSAPYRRAASDVVRGAEGFELTGVARSGDEAVALTVKLDPDLVLLDVRMPGMNGIEAARAIAAACPKTVVVLVSSWAEVDLPAGASQCGAAATLRKRDLRPGVLVELWREHGNA
jgi:two-component system, NarL family, invasion response regulator UvrY